MIRGSLKETYPLVYEHVIMPLENDGKIDLDSAWDNYDLAESFNVISARLAELLGVESVDHEPDQPWPVEEGLAPMEVRDLPPPQIAMAEVERRFASGKLRPNP